MNEAQLQAPNVHVERNLYTIMLYRLIVMYLITVY